MDIKTLQQVRERLSRRVSALAGESQSADDDGFAARSDQLWHQMRGARQALEIVDSLITECDGL